MLHLDPVASPLDAALHVAPLLAPLTTLASLTAGIVWDRMKGGR